MNSELPLELTSAKLMKDQDSSCHFLEDLGFKLNDNFGGATYPTTLSAFFPSGYSFNFKFFWHY